MSLRDNKCESAFKLRQFYTNIRNIGVDFDRTRLSTTVVRERSQPGIPLFHLLESSNNTEVTTFYCILPGRLEHAGLPNMEGEAEPSGFPPVSALGLSCSASPRRLMI